MHAIVVKLGFTVLAAFRYIFDSETPLTTILNVVGCEDCVRKNKLPLQSLGVKPPAAGQFLQFFFE